MSGAGVFLRAGERHLETRLARALIAGEVEEGATLGYSVKNGEIVFRPEVRK